jgi:O-antigen/teichoic acid export membrane protein
VSEPGLELLEGEGVAADVLDSRQAGGRIVRGAFVRLISYVGIVGLSVVSASLLTRYLGLTRFGRYTTIMSLVSVVAVVTDAGMAALGTREFAVRTGKDRDEFMRDLLGLRVLLTLAGVALSMVFVVAAGYGLEFVLGTLLASIATVLLVIQHTYSIPLSADLRISTVSLLDLGRQALTMMALVALVLGGAGVLPLLAVSLAVNAVAIVPTAALVRGRIALRVRMRPGRWAELLRLTILFSLANAVGTIYVYAAQILTSLAATPHQSGLFAASFRVFIAIAGVPGLLVGGALPLLARAARDDRERLHYALTRIFEVSLVLGVAASTAFIAGAHFVIAVIGGAKYEGAVRVLQVQGLAMIASFALSGWSFAVISLKRYKGMLVANAGALAVSCILTLTLARVDGAMGAAIATVCGEATLGAGYLAVMVRADPTLRPPAAIIWKVALSAAPAVAIALAVKLPSVPLTLIALLVYGVAILALRAVPPELLELVAPLRRFTRRSDG